MEESFSASQASETFLKYGAPWVLSGVGTYLGFPAYGNAAAFVLLVLLGVIYPQRIKPVEVVLALGFLLLWVGADGLQIKSLLACQSYLIPLLLTVMAFGSLLINAPFTLVYAREWAPREMWDNPHFYFVNRVLTALWGAGFCLAGLIKYEHALPWLGAMLTNFGIMFFIAAFTKWFPLWYRDTIYLKQPAKEVTA